MSNSELKEALQYAVEIAAPKTAIHGEYEFSSKPLHRIDVTPPPPAVFELQTLDGLGDVLPYISDAIVDKNGGPVIFKVTNPVLVSVVPQMMDKYNRRPLLAICTPGVVASDLFGCWQSQEKFLIWLQTQFEETPDRTYLINLASKISGAVTEVATDNGVAQQVTLNKALALKEAEVLRPVVTLAPYRTFREIKQPASKFLFRAQNKGGAPELTLYEADGGAWKLDATAKIANYLSDMLKSLQIPGHPANLGTTLAVVVR